VLFVVLEVYVVFVIVIQVVPFNRVPTAHTHAEFCKVKPKFVLQLKQISSEEVTLNWQLIHPFEQATQILF
jgi:hypothetical protein